VEGDVVVLVSVLGCSGGGVKDVAFEPYAIPGSGVVTFTTKKSGDAFVRFGTSEDALDQETPKVPADQGQVEVRGLVEGSKYFAEVVVADGSKEWTSDPIELTVGQPPDGVPALTQAEWNADLACADGGYLMFSYIGAGKSGVAIVDRLGQYVWAVALDSPNQTSRARPSRDGKSILYNVADENKREDIATIVRQPFDGSDPTITRTLKGHHDFVELPSGDFAWPAYDIREMDVMPDGDDSIKVPGGSGCVAAEVLYEGPEGMTDADTPTTIWDTWDDYPAGIYTLPAESDTFVKFPCADAGYEGLDNPVALEFQHANSLAYVDSEDAFYESWRWLDTFVKIGHDGTMAWQWGGLAGAPASDLVPANGTDPSPEHAHFSDVWAGGMLIYNNGHREDGDVGTTLREYSIDEAAGTFAMDWTYDPQSYDDVLGDVRRMPIDGCDNRLVSFSKKARVVELTADGQIAWEVDGGLGAIIGRVYWIPDLYDLSGLAYPE
jgi:hypothetical protein